MKTSPLGLVPYFDDVVRIWHKWSISFERIYMNFVEYYYKYIEDKLIANLYWVWTNDIDKGTWCVRRWEDPIDVARKYAQKQFGEFGKDRISVINVNMSRFCVSKPELTFQV